MRRLAFLGLALAALAAGGRADDLDSIIRQMRSEDAATREAGVVRAGQAEPNLRLADPLLAALKDKDQAVRIAAVHAWERVALMYEFDMVDWLEAKGFSDDAGDESSSPDGLQDKWRARLVEAMSGFTPGSAEDVLALHTLASWTHGTIFLHRADIDMSYSIAVPVARRLHEIGKARPQDIARLLDDPDPEIAAAASYAMPEDSSLFLAKMRSFVRSARADQRRLAAYHLPRIEKEQALSDVKPLLSDPDVRIRGLASDAIPQDEQAFERLLADPLMERPSFRVEMVGTARHRKSKVAAAFLEKSLSDPSGLVRCEAMEQALYQADDAGARAKLIAMWDPLLRASAAGKDPDERAAAYHLLCRSPDAAYATLFLAAVRTDPDLAIGPASAYFESASTKQKASWLASKEPQLRRLAIRTLDGDNDPDQAELLKAHLNDSDEDVAVTAISHFSGTDKVDQRFLEAMKPLVRSPRHAVSLAAIREVSYRPGPRSIQILLPVKDSPDLQVRYAVRRALRDLRGQ